MKIEIGSYVLVSVGPLVTDGVVNQFVGENWALVTITDLSGELVVPQVGVRVECLTPLPQPKRFGVLPFTDPASIISAEMHEAEKAYRRSLGLCADQHDFDPYERLSDCDND